MIWLLHADSNQTDALGGGGCLPPISGARSVRPDTTLTCGQLENIFNNTQPSPLIPFSFPLTEVFPALRLKNRFKNHLFDKPHNCPHRIQMYFYTE